MPVSNNSRKESDANLRNNMMVQNEAQPSNSCHESEIARQKLNDLLKSNKVIQSFFFSFCSLCYLLITIYLFNRVQLILMFMKIKTLMER